MDSKERVLSAFSCCSRFAQAGLATRAMDPAVERLNSSRKEWSMEHQRKGRCPHSLFQSSPSPIGLDLLPFAPYLWCGMLQAQANCFVSPILLVPSSLKIFPRPSWIPPTDSAYLCVCLGRFDEELEIVRANYTEGRGSAEWCGLSRWWDGEGSCYQCGLQDSCCRGLAERSG